MSVYSLTAKPQPKIVEKISEKPKKWLKPEVERVEIEAMDTNPLSQFLGRSVFSEEFLGPAPYSEKPLVCVAGEDRPPLVAEYQGSETCGYEQAQKLTELAYGLYHQSCEVPREQLETHMQELYSAQRPFDDIAKKYGARKSRFKMGVNRMTVIPLHPLSDLPIRRPIGSEFKTHFDPESKETWPITCGDGEFSIATILHNFGLLNPQEIHPFFNTVFHLNADQLHDFRSAESFK